MIEGIIYQKEKRKKRLLQKNRKKIAPAHAYGKSKKQVKHFFYEEQYQDNWELINSR